MSCRLLTAIAAKMVDWNDLSFGKLLVMQDHIAGDIKKAHSDIDAFCSRLNVLSHYDFTAFTAHIVVLAHGEHRTYELADEL